MLESSQKFVEDQLRLNKRRARLHPGLRWLIATLANLDVVGLDNVPTSGSTILISNHVSQADPVLFTGAIKSRYVVSMAKAETLNNPAQRLLLETWGNFVVKRGEIDRVAITNTIELIKSEQLVWIAPEGTRNPDGMAEAKGGISYIAYKSNAVVVPSAVCGPQDWVQRWMKFQKFDALIVFGKPFRFHLPEGERLSRQVRDQMLREAMYQIALTIPEEFADYRGVYRDVENATTDYLAFLE